MSIWHAEPTLEGLHAFNNNCLVGHLGIEWTGWGADSLSARMPVDHRTVQPFQQLHGGASVVLAETLASVGANMTLDPTTHRAVGLEINANHVRPVPSGQWVMGLPRCSPRAKPLRYGIFASPTTKIDWCVFRGAPWPSVHIRCTRPGDERDSTVALESTGVAPVWSINPSTGWQPRSTGEISPVDQRLLLVAQ